MTNVIKFTPKLETIDRWRCEGCGCEAMLLLWTGAVVCVACSAYQPSLAWEYKCAGEDVTTGHDR